MQTAHNSTPHARRSVAALLLLLASCLCVGTVCAAQTPKPAATPAPAEAGRVQLIPRPKQLGTTAEVFRLTRRARLVLADKKSEDDRFAAQDFLDDVREAAGVSLRLTTSRGSRQILVGPLSDERVREKLLRVGLGEPPGFDEEGYMLSVTGEEVVLGGKSAAGTFYGLQTLKQLVRGEGEAAFIQGVRITDWPSMRWRAVSDDISRGPVPTVEYVKRQLRTMAAFKLNMHSFYMEHTFGSVSHPLIAPEGGSLRPEEIRELVAYARRYHVELVPEQQTFGHLHKALKLEKYNELAEVPYGDVLSPQAEGTYKLVADWYEEIAELFPGKFFHIGADETVELGQGRSREAARERGVGAIYFEHLRRVRELLLPHGRRLMFWGDIALNHPELVSTIPRDMIVMNWDYTPRPSYEARINLFAKAGLEQFVCPGVHGWSQIFPNTEVAAVNITNFARDGQRAGVLGLMNTQWDDDGETLFEMSWYAVVLGAAASWQDAPVDISEFDRNFDWAFFRHEGEQLTKAARALGSVNAVLDAGFSNNLFWRDPFTDGFQEDVVRPREEKIKKMRLMVEEAEESLIRGRPRARRNLQAIDSMRFAARRFDHAGRRMQVVAQFSRDYWNAYLNLGDRAKAQRLRYYSSSIYSSLREMAEELSELRAAYREQWLRENRPYWLDSILARYDLAVSRWLAREKQLQEALREYERDSTLPPPAEFGLGSRPDQEE